MTHELHGFCHCGNLEVTYTTGIAPADAAPTDYDRENEAGKRRRRRDNQTPATLKLSE